MPKWILSPTNHDADIWKMYPVQRLVVEAPTEREARERVAVAAETALPPNPWLDPDLTACVEVEGN